MVTFPNPLGFVVRETFIRGFFILILLGRSLTGFLRELVDLIRMRNNKTENLSLTLAGLGRGLDITGQEPVRRQTSPPRIAVCASLLIKFTMSKNVLAIVEEKTTLPGMPVWR